MTRSVRDALSECNTKYDFIPAGFTSKVQMMDFGVTKPFKDTIWGNFDNWLVRKIKCVQQLTRNQHVKTWLAGE